MRRRAVLMPIALLAVLSACSSSAPQTATYTFNPQSSVVQVNSPQLRAEKAAAGIQTCPGTSHHAKPVTGGFPAITLPCLGGGPDVDLAGLRGVPTVVNFWAQTCGPCRTESPILQQFDVAARHAVRVLGVDWEDPRAGAAIAFAQQLGLTYPQIADPDGATRGPLRVQGLPITFFVAPSGKVTYTHYGAMTSLSQVTALVHQHLGVTVATGGAGGGAR